MKKCAVPRTKQHYHVFHDGIWCHERWHQVPHEQLIFMIIMTIFLNVYNRHRHHYLWRRPYCRNNYTIGSCYWWHHSASSVFLQPAAVTRNHNLIFRYIKSEQLFTAIQYFATSSLNSYLQLHLVQRHWSASHCSAFLEYWRMDWRIYSNHGATVVQLHQSVTLLYGISDSPTYDLSAQHAHASSINYAKVYRWHRIIACPQPLQ